MEVVEQEIRGLARRHLPGAVRKPLGKLAGNFLARVVAPIEGLIFDLKGRRFHADGCNFAIPGDVTSRAYRSCFLGNKYEREERELVRRWIRPTDSVIELGACLGIVSCVTNKLLADKSRHVVVEANPFCIAPLNRNRELNQAGFLIEHCAIAKPPEATFYLHPTYIVGGTCQRQTARAVRLPAKTLNQLEREHGPFTALIIDIEGSELDVFSDSMDLLRGYRLVIAELHEFALGAAGVERCRQLLSEAGLRNVGTAGITEAWERA